MTIVACASVPLARADFGVLGSLVERQVDEGHHDRQPEEHQERDEQGDAEPEVAALEFLVHHSSGSIAIATKSSAR